MDAEKTRLKETCEFLHNLLTRVFEVHRLRGTKENSIDALAGSGTAPAPSASTSEPVRTLPELRLRVGELLEQLKDPLEAHRARLAGVGVSVMEIRSTLMQFADDPPKRDLADLDGMGRWAEGVVAGKNRLAAYQTADELLRHALIQVDIEYGRMATQPAQSEPVEHRVARLEAAAPRQNAKPDLLVLWEGAEHSGRNISLARTRTAYLEAHGSVAEALESLKEGGHGISRSTFYNHLTALDDEIPGWRNSVQSSRPGGNPDGLRAARTRRKPMGEVG